MSEEITSQDDRHAIFDRQKTVLSMYSDNAKTFVQLSGFALGLTLTFTDKILHLASTENIATGWMIAVWSLYLIAIGAGAFYQFLAAKLLDTYLDWGHDETWDWLAPGYVYGAMLLTFYGATVMFTIYAIVRIRNH